MINIFRNGKLLGCVFFMAAVFIAFGYTFVMEKNANQTKSWLTTKGEVLAHKSHYGRFGSSISLSYRYQVSGKSYTNNVYEINQNNMMVSSQKMKLFIKKLNSDNKTTVYFNPMNPKESVLKKSNPAALQRVLWLRYILLLIFVILLGYFVFLVRKDNQNIELNR